MPSRKPTIAQNHGRCRSCSTHTRVAPRPCEWCGTLFQPRSFSHTINGRGRFCGHACRAKSQSDAALRHHGKHIPLAACSHCGKKVVVTTIRWRRGLCGRCYDTPTIRKQHKSATDQGYGLTAPMCLPAEPTTELPGTEQKLAVLMARAAAGEHLWHPLDAPEDLS